MDYKLELNEKQYEAVTSQSQYLRIIAGAGSGKTRVLTYRIAFLVEKMNVNPSKILAITFTNKAAKEMKDRVDRLFGQSFSNLSVMTFHAFCARFLRKEIMALNYPQGFTILDDEDQGKVIKDICKARGYNTRDDIVKAVPGFISYNKNLGLFADDVKPSINRPQDREMISIYKDYEKRLRDSNSLDFDDLLLLTNFILKNFDDVREKWKKRFSHILIDEFQDTNGIQYSIVKQLMSDETSLYVVGDPDQTIYTWRGANQDIILDLEKEYDIETITLEENYRSTKEILNAANMLIKNNKKRIEKQLFTKKLNGDKVFFRCFDKQLSEAQFVVREIQNLTNREFDYRDIVIMYRSNYLSLPYEKVLTSERIPYVIYGGVKFYQRKEVKDVLAFIKLLSNVNDDLSFDRIINVPRRGIGDNSIEKLKDGSSSLGLSLAGYIDTVSIDETNIPKRQFKDMKALVELIKKYSERFNNGENLSTLVDDLLGEIHYFEYLNKEDNADDRVGNVKTLLSDLKQNLNNGNTTLEDYLENIALMSSQDYVEDENRVTLMTVHVAKGLEFPVVFVVSMNEGVFPNARAIEERLDGIEEERRLCYVAFTRAMKKLYVTSYYNSFRGSYSVPSKFIDESGLNKKEKTFINISNSRNPINRELIDKINNIVQKKENNIIWNVGDIAYHTTFKRGKVIKIDGPYITIEFESEGVKKMIGNHHTLSKIEQEKKYEA